MLKINSNEISWSDIAEVIVFGDESGIEVSITVEETVLVVGNYPTAAQAESIKNLIEASKTASSFGGVVITIDIDSL